MNNWKRLWLSFKTVLRHPTRIVRLGDLDVHYKKQIMKKYEVPRRVNISQIVPNLDERLVIANLLGTYTVEVALMKGLIKEIENCRFLEIGTAEGITANALAEECLEMVTIDISSGDNIGKYCINDNIKQVTGDSRKINFEDLGEFDMIFIDGDHHYAPVKSDTENAFKVLKDQGIIMWHDVMWDNVIRWQVLAAIFDGTPENAEGYFYLIDRTKSGIYISKKILVKNKEPDIFDIKMRLLEGRGFK